MASGSRKIAPPSRERAQRHAGGSGEENDWLATYGDLMSLLLVFFVLFYIFSVTGQMPLLQEALQKYQAENSLRAPGLPQDQSPTPQLASGEVVISIPSELLFDLGQADLKQAALPRLAGAVDSLRRVLARYPEAQVRVEGYTDNIPIHNWRFRNNWELSVARAISVVRYLIEEEQFEPTRLQAMGYGEYNPVAANDSPANRQRNRRVEVKVVAPPGALVDQSDPAERLRRSSEENASRSTKRILTGEDEP